MEILKSQLYFSWYPFFGSFPTLTEIQMQAMPVILNQNSLIISAPTAGGKTNAAIAPIAEMIARNKYQHGETNKKIKALYISPTRALVNDLYERLHEPLVEMGLSVQRKTADHALAKNSDFLITTPESFEAFLTLRKELLTGVEYLIIDELHLLLDTPRGDHLRALCKRLKLLLTKKDGNLPLQIIIMSATLKEPKKVAEDFIGTEFRIISTTGARELQSEILTAFNGEKDHYQKIGTADQRFNLIKKVLIFVPARKTADQAGSFQVGCFKKYSVLAHHGSLSRERRISAEDNFREEGNVICVATSTLEVGIDIGTIDLIINLGLPNSINSFLQRIGRGCRRLKDVQRVLCIARNPLEEFFFEAIINFLKNDFNNEVTGFNLIRTPFIRLSVLAHQIIAYLFQGQGKRTIKQLMRIASVPSILCETPLSKPEDLELCLEALEDQGYLIMKDEIVSLLSKGNDLVGVQSFWGNFSSAYLGIELINIEDGKVIGKVRELPNPEKFVVGGNATKVLYSESGRYIVKDTGLKKSINTPNYSTKTSKIDDSLGTALRSYLQIIQNAHTLLCLDLNPNNSKEHKHNSFILFTWRGTIVNRVLKSLAGELGLDCTETTYGIKIQTNYTFFELHLKFSEKFLEYLDSTSLQLDLLDNKYLSEILDLGAHVKLINKNGRARDLLRLLNFKGLYSWWHESKFDILKLPQEEQKDLENLDYNLEKIRTLIRI